MTIRPRTVLNDLLLSTIYESSLHSEEMTVLQRTLR